MRPDIEQIKVFFKKFGNIVKKYNPVTKSGLRAFFGFVRRSWKSILVTAPVLIFLYYAVGSRVSQNIDKQTDFELPRVENGLTVVDAAAFLIKREVDDHLWTPNLPIIFPGYVLDNMPNFQSGIIWSERVLAKVLQRHYDSKELAAATELLNYPVNIWLLSKTKNLALAPSSGAQYRKARQALLSFNKESAAKTPKKEFLIALLTQMQKKFSVIDASLEKQVQEENSVWIDLKADDVFYENQGRLYGFYVILKALAVDYEKTILKAEQYQAWTSMLKALEDALALDPLVVRNGSSNAVLTPNHLLLLDLYTVKARYLLGQILSALKE